MINRKNISLILLILIFKSLISCSQEKATENKVLNITTTSRKTAEELVASKKTSDMSYKQLMNILNSGSVMIHQGILIENKQMVIEGTGLILNHAAPKENPWLIMNTQDHEGFKNSLLAYDIVLDNYSRAIAEEAKKEDWLEASKKSHELMNSCIVCHSMWKYKVK